MNTTQCFLHKNFIQKKMIFKEIFYVMSILENYRLTPLHFFHFIHTNIQKFEEYKKFIKWVKTLLLFLIRETPI